MWNRDKSLLLSIISVKVFFVIWLLLFVGGYFICDVYVKLMEIPDKFIVILPTLYVCLIPAFIILYDLYKVLINIRADNVFIDHNVKYLRTISWACIAIAMFTVISAFGYPSFLIIAVAFGFFALLIRVIKNVIAQAIEIKTENDYTI